MNDAKFNELLDVYGAAFEKWPPQHRQAGQQWLLESEAAQQLWADEQRVATLLDTWDTPAPSSAVQRNVAEIPLRRARPKSRSRASSANWGVLLGFSAMACLGFWLGSWTAPVTDDAWGGVDVDLQSSAEAVSETNALGAGDEETTFDELALATGFAEAVEEGP